MVSMAAADGMLSLSVSSMVEDILRQHGARLSDIDLASRKEEEASLRRYQAAGWLRKMVGVVAAKDLPAEPSEEDFRLGLRSGIILCNVLNKIQPGAVSKVVEAPNDSMIIPDGAALMAYQYFENVRNFLVAIEEMGLPAFEASDLEQGGKTARIVNCVLALKSYSEWKQGGGCGMWKNVKPPSVSSSKAFVRKNSEPFMNSISRTSSVSEKSLEAFSQDGELGLDFGDMSNGRSLNTLVRAVLSDKRQDEIPYIVESMLSKVVEEFERRLVNQREMINTTSVDHIAISGPSKSSAESSLGEIQDDQSVTGLVTEEESNPQPEYNEGPGTGKILEIEQIGGSKTGKLQELEWIEVTETGKLQELERIERPEAGKVPELERIQRPETVKIQEVQRIVVQKPDFSKHNRQLEIQQRDVQELKHTIYSTKKGMQALQMKYQEEMSLLGRHLSTLAHAASGYKRVLEENRKLYNLVQDLKGNIRVYCRVRPFLPGQMDAASSVDRVEEGTITILTPLKYGKDTKKSFTFNKVFGPSTTQAEVFADTQPLVRSVLDGFNVCIFAYGQTGSGKTYTMSGPNNLTEETFGVNYRALNDLFDIAKQRQDTVCYEVSVQMMEIYNEQVRDLLVTDGSNKKLEIRNSSQSGINVPDANRLPVASTADVINLMNLGQKNRAVCATAMNDRSSRSHSCLTVHVQGRDLTSGTVLRGCMHLVDLAGSERVEKSEVTGDRLKEAVHINKSLSALGDVIASLAQKNAHVPYRNSKLTQLLQDALGGQAKTLMFVHISPEPDALGETLSTLKFAERVSTVELGAAKANRENGDVKELKEQIANLKAALAKKEEEVDQLSGSLLSSSPESLAMKSRSSSPSNSSWKSGAGSNKANGNSKQKPRRRSLDPQDLPTVSAPWPSVNGHKQEGKNTASRNQDGRRSSFGILEDSLNPLDRLTANGQDKYDEERSRNEEATPDDIDELEVATSDSSDLDFHMQVNLPRVASLPNGMGMKNKKTQIKQQPKSTETRSSIPTPSARRTSNGASPTVKNGRQSLYVKRKPVKG